MKFLKLTIILLSVILLANCKSYLLIGENKVSFYKVCGSQGKYKCEATGESPKNLSSHRNYLKQRPDGKGKNGAHGFNYYNLGGTVDNVAFHNPVQTIIDLEKSDLEKIDTVLVDYDFKQNNLSDILAELGTTLKKEKIDLDISANILNDFKKELENKLVIEGKIITFTLKPHIKRGIMDAKAGIETDIRYLNAYKRLRKNGYPFVRQVKVIEETSHFSENVNLSTLLEAVLKTQLGEETANINGILNATLAKEKSSKFSSHFKLTTIYSYGYWNDHWMY